MLESGKDVTTCSDGLALCIRLCQSREFGRRDNADQVWLVGTASLTSGAELSERSSHLDRLIFTLMVPIARAYRRKDVS